MSSTEQKPGWKTTEFWLALVVIILASFLLAFGSIAEETWKWAVAAAVGPYAISRGLSKLKM